MVKMPARRTGVTDIGMNIEMTISNLLEARNHNKSDRFRDGSLGEALAWALDAFNDCVKAQRDPLIKNAWKNRLNNYLERAGRDVPYWYEGVKAS
jgi:hypothetical protein